MASRYELPEAYAVGTEVAGITRYSYGTAPIIKTGKVVKRTATQITVEFVGKGATYKERFVADYATREQGSLEQYGTRSSYTSTSVRLYLATSAHVTKARSEAVKLNVVRSVKEAAASFGKGQPTVEEAEQLIAQLQRFIAASK